MKPSEVPDDLLALAATALSRYDWDHGISANPDVGQHQRAEVATVLAAVLPAHERQVRERVAAENAVLAPADLAALLNYVVGREGIRVVDEATLDRAFAALKATKRGES